MPVCAKIDVVDVIQLQELGMRRLLAQPRTHILGGTAQSPPRSMQPRSDLRRSGTRVIESCLQVLVLSIIRYVVLSADEPKSDPSYQHLRKKASDGTSLCSKLAVRP